MRLSFFLLVLLFACGTARAEMFVPPQKVIPPSLFGLHIHRLASTTPWPDARFNAWSLIDAYVTWNYLQPAKSRWNFSTLDKYVLRSHGKNVEMLYPLAFTPQWASARPADKGPYGPGSSAEPLDMNDWNEYVKALVTRYRGRIRYFMVWDEPNEKAYFSGSQQKLLELVSTAYIAMKRIDPDSRMVSPGLVGPSSFAWLDDFLRSGGAACVDIIGFHFYPPISDPDKTEQRPESMIPTAKRVKSIMARYGIAAKPLWNTGVGYWNVNGDGTPENTDGVDSRWIRLDQDRAAAWLSRTYILSWALGMERVFWYSWDHFNMGLIEPTSKALKPAGKAYQRTFDWLVGSKMTYCSNDGPQWVCELTRGKRKAWLVWRTAGNASTQMPAVWGAKEVLPLLGAGRELKRPDQPIMIGEQPVLVKGDTKPW